jgi:hypothetical protein
MIFRTTLALSVVAVLASASAAMAATTHRPQRAVQQHASTASEASSSYAVAARFRNQPGPYYYDQGSSGSVWSYYPGYVPMTRE